MRKVNPMSSRTMFAWSERTKELLASCRIMQLVWRRKGF